MSIREVRKQRSKTSDVFYKYNLVQAARVDGKVKQKIILYIESAPPLLRDRNNRKTVLEVLKSMLFKRANLFADKVPKNLFALAQSHYDRYLRRALVCLSLCGENL